MTQNWLITAIAFILLYLGAITPVSGQVGVDKLDGEQPEDTLVVNLADYLPPLPVLIDSAIANSPEVEYFSQRQKMAEYDVSIQRKEWLRNIRANASYFGGTNTILNQGLALGGYNYGVGVTIPLGDLFTLGDRVNKAKATMAAEAANRKEQERLIIKRVEETYNRLFVLRQLIEHATEAMESARFIYEQGETRFVRGELSLDELGQNTDLKTKWASNYTRLKGEFYNTYRLLQRLVGVPFSKF
jgi:outer membrane protein TolC